MKKFLLILSAIIILGFSGYYAFIYFFSFSHGYRAGELVKFSKKGVIFKTWEGQISQEATQPLWNFSVQDNEPEVIQKLKNLQGKNVKLTYMERFKTFPWLGDTKYFVTDVVQTDIKDNTTDKEVFETQKSDVTDITVENLRKENELLRQRIKDLETTIEILRQQSSSSGN